MENTIKSMFKSILSNSGVFNINNKSDLHKHNDINQEYTIVVSESNFKTDKSNLKSDYKNVKGDISKGWAKVEEELVY